LEEKTEQSWQSSTKTFFAKFGYRLDVKV